MPRLPHRQVLITIVCLTALFFLSAPSAQATGIPLHEAFLAIDSTIVDTEYALVNYALGNEIDQVLNYNSIITDGGWIGTLSGTHLGNALNVEYAATATLGSPGPPVTYNFAWTSTGTYGTEVWTSSGDGVYVDPPLSATVDLQNMQLGLSVSGSVGVGSVTLGMVKDLDDALLTVGVTASALDVPILGSVLEKELSFTLNQVTGGYTSQEEFRALFGLLSKTITWNRGRIFHTPDPPPPDPPPPPPPPYPDPLDDPYRRGANPDPFGESYNQMELGLIPEPSTVFLVGAGLVAFGLWRRRSARPPS
jgi:PEP-CTERM motif-containing protein